MKKRNGMWFVAIGTMLTCLLLTMGCTRRPVVPATRPAQSAHPSITPGQGKQPSFLNTSLDVAYVEESTCGECHREIADQFAQHPMGNSLAPIESARRIEGFDSQHKPQFAIPPFNYAVQASVDGLKQGRSLISSEPADTPSIAEESDVAYSVGSGQRGRSYLIEHENYLTMSPLTWYPKQQFWSLSPGYEHNDLGFSRPVQDDCLFCHSNRAHFDPNSKNKITSPFFSGHAIGCQRCHGPGDLHVKHHQTGAPTDDIDRTIVNPAHLTPQLRASVCQQCHLAGAARVVLADKNRYDFRPGQALDSVMATYVLAPSGNETQDHFVGQVEQMYASRCFIASVGEMGCVSCHDPHRMPDPKTKLEFYRARCLECHQTDSCEETLEERLAVDGIDNCIRCHMPPSTTDVRHAATTNHRIPRDTSPPATSKKPSLRQTYAIVPFPTRTHVGDEFTEMRNLAIGHLQAALYHPQRVTPNHLKKLRAPLAQAVKRNPQDLAAAEALGAIMQKLGGTQLASEQYRRVLEQVPDREHSRVMLADALAELGQIDEAAEHWEAAVELNPWLPAYRYRWGAMLAATNRWPEVHKVSTFGVARFPTSVPLWRLRLESQLHAGQLEAATQSLRVLLQLNPEAQSEIQTWFDQHPQNRSEHSTP